MLEDYSSQWIEEIVLLIKTIFYRWRSSFFSWLLETIASLELWSWWGRFPLIFSVILILFLGNDNFLTSNKSKILIKNLDWFISACDGALNILFDIIFCVRKRELVKDNNFLFLIEVFNIIKFMTDLIEKRIHWLISQWLSRIFRFWCWRPFSWCGIL